MTDRDSIRKSAEEWRVRGGDLPLPRETYDEESERRALELAGISPGESTPDALSRAVLKAIQSGDSLYSSLVLAARAAAPSPRIEEGDEPDPCVAFAKARGLVRPDATDAEGRAAAGRVLRDWGHPLHLEAMRVASAGSPRDLVTDARLSTPVEKLAEPEDSLVRYVKRAGLVKEGEDPDAAVGRVLRDERHPHYRSLIDVLAAEGALPRRRG